MPTGPPRSWTLQPPYRPAEPRRRVWRELGTEYVREWRRDPDGWREVNRRPGMPLGAIYMRLAGQALNPLARPWLIAGRADIESTVGPPGARCSLEGLDTGQRVRISGRAAMGKAMLYSRGTGESYAR